MACEERERLLKEWMDCLIRLRLLQGQELASLKMNDPDYRNFESRIQIARAADVEACRAYCQHVDQHECLPSMHKRQPPRKRSKIHRGQQWRRSGSGSSGPRTRPN